MRIIAGKYRGRKIKSPPSLQVRPTSDRLRETLFNVIAPIIVDARFLDLCSGSGAVGIEALSRGAAHVTFVDQSRKMCSLIKANLDLILLPEEQTTIVPAEAGEFLRTSTIERVEPWDVVFFDPPYDSNYQRVLEIIGNNVGSLLTADASVIAEHHHKTELLSSLGALHRYRILKQGDSALSFYQRITERP